ncbi:MAG: redoxin domain-containing protein [Anaerolineaceae bacterium]|nr:redoxin domain-containing protein [Anaerolineaceae bacterium]
MKRRKASKFLKRKSMLSLFLVIGGVLMLGGIFLIVENQFQPDSVDDLINPPRVGESMSDFTLIDVEGNQVSLRYFEGRPVLINAWATWCPPCRAEMPDLNAYYQAHQEEGFMILAVNAGESQKEVTQFTEHVDLDFPVLMDPGNGLLNELRVFSFPTSILVGRDGLVKAIHIGLFTPEMMEEEITPHLK